MPKTLIYDGDCPMCGWISRRFGAVGLADDPHRRPYQEFDGEMASRLDEAGIRNEMLVLDAGTGELRAGIEGFLWLLADSRWSWLGGLLSVAPVRALLVLLYRTIAYNRRLVAPPPRGVVCACDPDPRPGYRALLLVALGLVDLAGVWLLGLAVSRAFDGSGPVPIAVLGILAVLAVLLTLRVSLPLEPVVLLGSVLMVLAAGMLVAAPGLALSLAFDGMTSRVLVGGSIGLGLWRCLRSARRRQMRPGLGTPQPRLKPNG